MTRASARPLTVGLQVPHWEGGVGGLTPHWADLLALAQRAEAVGFDSLWVADHPWTSLREFHEVSGHPVSAEVVDLSPGGLWEA